MANSYLSRALPPPPPGDVPSPRKQIETAPRALSPRAMLQVAAIWHGTIIGYRLQRRRRKITLGPHKRATFCTPPVRGADRFPLLTPRKNGYVLNLAPEMRGEVHVGGQVMSVADVSSSAVDLVVGDRAKLTFADGSDLRIEIRWVDPPDVIPRPRINDPEMVRTTVGTSVVLGLLALLLTFMWEKEAPRPPLALDPNRITKIEAPQAIEFEKQQVKKRQEETAKAQEKSKEKEGQMTKAKEKAGKLGRADAKEKDTIIPKGREDILREKVQNTGLLSIFGHQKAPGSGISKLFSQSNDVEQAMAGMAGAKLVAGRGAGGLSTSGSGSGGGGTGFGHIYGAGNLDTGGRGHSGKGRGPKLAERGEHEVSVGLGAGGGDADGSLSKEQINKVVKAHLAGVKYCYEKELQHKTSLAGGVDIFWVIQPDGTVSKANVKSSSMNDAAVEGCIVRQVKQWQFPKAPAQTTVTRYPFIFKGG